MEKLRPLFPRMAAAWTAKSALPGGNMPWDGVPALRDALLYEYPYLPRPTLERLVRTYGNLTWRFMEPIQKRADMGRTIGAGLTEYEVDWLRENEWARTADDILWRRTKLGLVFEPRERAALQAFMDRP